MSAPFSVLRIDHVVLRVAQLERAVEFYGSVLGCRVERRRDELGLVHLRAGASQIDLVAVDGPLGQRGGAGPGATGHNVDHVCLRVEPFESGAIFAHLEAHGVTVTATSAANFGAEGTGPSLYLLDPDGNSIELKGPATVPP